MIFRMKLQLNKDWLKYCYGENFKSYWVKRGPKWTQNEFFKFYETSMQETFVFLHDVATA